MERRSNSCLYCNIEPPRTMCDRIRYHIPMVVPGNLTLATLCPYVYRNRRDNLNCSRGSEVADCLDTADKAIALSILILSTHNTAWAVAITGTQWHTVVSHPVGWPKKKNAAQKRSVRPSTKFHHLKNYPVLALFEPTHTHKTRRRCYSTLQRAFCG